MLEALLAGGLSLVGGWAGAYFGGYLKKKGENLATHEDIDKLVDQVRVVTQATKEIEAKISSDVWNQQKQWEMKREVLFDAAKRIVELDNGLVALDSLLRMDDPDGDQWAEARNKAVTGWLETLKKFDETRLLIGITCSKETSLAMNGLSLFVTQFGAKLANKDSKAFEESSTTLSKGLQLARLAIRRELGIDETAALHVSAGK